MPSSNLNEIQWADDDFSWTFDMMMMDSDGVLSALVSPPLAPSSPIASPSTASWFIPQRMPYSSEVFAQQLPQCPPLVLPPLSPPWRTSCFSPGFLEKYELRSSCFSPEPEEMHDSSKTMSPRKMPEKRLRDDDDGCAPAPKARRRRNDDDYDDDD